MMGMQLELTDVLTWRTVFCEFCMSSAELNPIIYAESLKMQSYHLRAAFPPWRSILLEWLGVNIWILEGWIGSP